MVLLYKRMSPWTNEEYINFKNELNAIGVKITSRYNSGSFSDGWAHERIRVKYSRNERIYFNRIKNVRATLCKYDCDFTQVL